MKKTFDFNKKQKGKGRSSDLTPVAKVSNRKVFDHKHIKILTLKQTLQRLETVLAQVKSSYTTENLVNEIKQIMYFSYPEKEVTKKVYNNIMILLKL